MTDITGIVGPSIENGNHRPFSRRAREGQEYTVLAKFEVRLSVSLPSCDCLILVDFASGQIMNGNA